MDAASRSTPSTVLLTGATGYIGGRLVRLLERDGYTVRCMARRPEAVLLTEHSATEVVAGDVLDRTSLDDALRGMEAAYYLVHSMGSSGSFVEADRQAARNFAAAAKGAGVRRIIYVGALGSDDETLSPHLQSRQEVGEILRESGAQVIELRASIVIGAGSLSFEMIRALVERLPFMVTPKWVGVLAQPIAIDDLLQYLLAALRLPATSNVTYEVGGTDRVSYADIMHEYARQRGMHIRMLPVPILSPRLSSLWLGLVTPLYARVGRKLIESIIHPTVVEDDRALQAFAIRPMGITAAIARALSREDREFAETRWSDAMSASGEPQSWGGVPFGTRLVDSRTVTVQVPAAAAFAPIQAIGGTRGWYGWGWLWRIRGCLDMLVGGVGMRRGRPHPTRLRVCDTLDFWRVEVIEPDRRLRLAAEMKVPGRAWLEFEVEGQGDTTTIRQTASFDPVGLFGRVYWYALFPLHQLVFAGMLRGIAREAERMTPPLPRPTGARHA
ncbi:MAG: SDR family oxidoreductase [Gemmatimonadales bacterium]